MCVCVSLSVKVCPKDMCMCVREEWGGEGSGTANWWKNEGNSGGAPRRERILDPSAGGGRKKRDGEELEIVENDGI